MSAAVTAAVLDEPVEDLSQRGESSRVVANPDGSFTEEAYGAPMWIQNADGAWVDVDYSLVPRAAGGFEPKAAPTDLVIDGGSKEFARLVLPDGTESIWSWPLVLPTPSVEGPVATYAVAEGVDLVVTATARGVSTWVRVNSPEAVVPNFRVNVRTVGAGLELTDEGALALTPDKVEDASAVTPTLLAWDARVDAWGDPVKVVPVEAELDETASKGERTDHALTLQLPAELVDDPEVVYPITIDPDLAPYGPSQDTWVREGVTWISDLEYRLIVGASADHENSNPAISYLKWPNDMQNRAISDAEVGFFQYMAASCSNRTVMVYPLSSSWNEASTKYSNRPSANGAVETRSSFSNNIGASGCTPAGGWVTADVTAMTQKWANTADHGGFINHGLQLSVPVASQDDFSFERRLCSVNYLSSHSSCNSASKTPYLKFTYTNRAPYAPEQPTVSASRTFGGSLWTSTAAPTFATSSIGVWGTRLKFTFDVRTSTTATTSVATCTTTTGVAAWVQGSCAVSGLTNGGSYVVRAKATDNNGLVGPWSAWRAFGVDSSAAPAAPTVTCDGFSGSGGLWPAVRPAPTTQCTFASTGAAEFAWSSTDGAQLTERQPLLPPAGSGNVRTPNIEVPVSGVVKLQVRALTRAGASSSDAVFVFGVGTTQVLQPIVDDRSTSTFPVHAQGRAGAVSARVEWRYAPETEGDENSGWVEARQVRYASTGGGWTGAVEAHPIAQTPQLVWNASKEAGISVPSLVHVRVVFTYAGNVTKPSPERRVQLLPHAFGGAYPTEDIGIGTLALFTGEYRLEATDVSVPGSGGHLQFGRAHATLAGTPAGPAGVFGPGWTADFAGEGTGLAGMVVTDNTALDGSFVLTSASGVSLVYAHEDGVRGGLRAGRYSGVGDVGLAMDDVELTVGGSGGATHTLSVTEQDGTITDFQRTSGGAWVTARTVSPEESTVTFLRNSNGLPDWVFSAAPDGVNCSASSQPRGCRGLHFEYISTAGGQRVSLVQYRAWDPKPDAAGKPSAAASMATIDVARYAYNSQGQLAEAWEPQSNGDLGTGRRTRYEYTTYNSKPVVSIATDPGEAPWRFGYDSEGRLSTVMRSHDPAVGTGEATWTVAYGVPLSGEGLPDLTDTATRTWGQPAADAPTGATAVFEPDRVPAPVPNAQDWAHASISYFTQAGRTTNTAVNGAGEWLVASQRYDAHENTIWELSASGRQASLESADPLSSSDRHATWTVYNSAGTREEASYGPMRQTTLGNNSVVMARSVTEIAYDDEVDQDLVPGKPAPEPGDEPHEGPDPGLLLPVEVRTSATDSAKPAEGGPRWDTRRTRYRYDPVEDGDASGWDLRLPTRTLLEVGEDRWETDLARYDSLGRAIETRTPAGTALHNGSANDVHSTITTYYTANADAADAACRNRPEWDGQLCTVRAAAPPSTGHSLPTQLIAGYSMRGGVTREEETSATWTRAVATSHDFLGRDTAQTISLTNSSPISTATTYNPTTGSITSLSGSGWTETYTYDTWGRQRTASDGTGNTATTTYNTAGQIATFDDGKGTYTYTYGGIDALGRTERRPLVTQVDTGSDVGSNDTFKGAYDADGNLIFQAMPHGYTATWKRDPEGKATDLAYADAESTPILAFARTFDNLGQVTTDTGPASSQRYSYNRQGWLTQVQDGTDAGCETRRYTFANDGNRTSLSTWAPDGDGGCQDSTEAVTADYSYDQADRLTNPGYSYDVMGRTLTVAKADTSAAQDPGADNLTASYFADDMVSGLEQTITAGNTTEQRRQSFSLDASGRVSRVQHFVNGEQLDETLNHYDGVTDSPAWTLTKTRPDPTSGWAESWTRYVSGLTGGLALIVNQAGQQELQFANLHGDIVATAASGLAGLANYSESTEYGQPRDLSTTRRYGWLGTHQRDSSLVGAVMLMGARLYSTSTGRFLSADPIPGGTENRYAYPLNPITSFDLDGEAACMDKESYHDCQVRHGNKAHKKFSAAVGGSKRMNGKGAQKKKFVVPDGRVKKAGKTTTLELKPTRRAALAACRRTARLTGENCVAVEWSHKKGGDTSTRSSGRTRPARSSLPAFTISRGCPQLDSRSTSSSVGASVDRSAHS